MINYKIITLFVISIFAAKMTFTQSELDCGLINDEAEGLPSAESFHNLMSMFAEAQDYKKASYLYSQLHLYHPDFKTGEMDSLKALYDSSMPKNKDCECTLPGTGDWVSAQGPMGADATSFYLDKNGGYWLGTGSSGGVYFSSNKGKSWESRNKGLGPWHVFAFLEENDSLFIQINTYPSGRNGRVRIYVYDKSVEGWKIVPGYCSWRESYCEGRAGQVFWKMREKSKENYLEHQDVLNYTAFYGAQYSYSEFSYYYDRGVHPNHSLNDYSNKAKMRVFGFRETDANKASLNKNFPRDMFTLINGNLLSLSKKEQVLLSKSGLYKVKKQQTIMPMGLEGVVATDVRQLISTGDKMYALVNEADVWLYEGNAWSCIFNSYERHLERIDPISHLGYDTKQMNLQKDGSLLFVFCGELWEMKSDESFHKIELDLTSIKSKFNDPKIIVSSAGYDVNGELYVQLDVLRYLQAENGVSRSPDVEESSALCKVVDGKPELISTNDERRSFIFNDRTGQLWHKSQDAIEMIGVNSINNPLLPEYGTSGWISQFTFRENGDFALFHDGKITEWSVEKKEWSTLTDNVPDNATCLSYSSDGEMYVGTGMLYQHGCGGGPYDGEYYGYEGESNGIYKWTGENWLPILGTPNVWTFSLAPSKEYGLTVGTSGSGVQFLKTK